MKTVTKYSASASGSAVYTWKCSGCGCQNYRTKQYTGSSGFVSGKNYAHAQAGADIAVKIGEDRRNASSCLGLVQHRLTGSCKQCGKEELWAQELNLGPLPAGPKKKPALIRLMRAVADHVPLIIVLLVAVILCFGAGAVGLLLIPAYVLFLVLTEKLDNPLKWDRDYARREQEYAQRKLQLQQQRAAELEKLPKESLPRFLTPGEAKRIPN